LLPEVEQFACKHGLTSTAQEELQGMLNASIVLTQKRVTVCVPATVANLGPGLESCGLAVDVWDEFTLEYAEQFSVDVSGADSQIPRTAENLVVVGASCAFSAAGRPLPPLHFSCAHRIPFGSGLGAASASFVGGYLAGSVLCNEELRMLDEPNMGSKKRSELDLCEPVTPSAMQSMDGGSGSMEAKFAQMAQRRNDKLAEHNGVDSLLQTAIGRGWNPGNVCPAIYGALQIGTDTFKGFRSHRVPVPTGLVCVIFIPDGQEEGQALPPQPVDRKAAIFNVGRAALLINCFCSGDFSMFSKATEDTLAQPHVASQFAHLTPVLQAAMEAGAAGAVPCGYGPAAMALITGRSGDVMAQSASNQLERGVAKAMLDRAEEVGLSGQVLITKPADVGAHVVASKTAIGAPDPEGRIAYFQ